MNRIDRLSAILIQLQSKKVVKAREIADRFGISLRTVYRDVRSLEEGGVPIIGEAGLGYSLMEGYRLPPVMFTREEAIAFLMAEKLLEKYSDSYNSNNYKAALYKIKAVLRGTEKDFIDDIGKNIIVLKNEYLPRDKEELQALPRILKAIHEKQVLNIVYGGIYAESTTARDVEPIGIFLQNTNWYLIAFCRLRKDYRNFKVARIKQLTPQEETFEMRHQPLAKYLEHTTEQLELHPVKILVEREAARYLVTEKYYYGFVSEEMQNSHVEMTFLAGSLERFAKFYVMIGDGASIVSPHRLKDVVEKHLCTIKARLK